MQMIIVNGRRKSIPEGAITHSALCVLAFGVSKRRPDSLKEDKNLEVTFIKGGTKDGTGTVKVGGKTDPVREQDFKVERPKKEEEKEADSKK